MVSMCKCLSARQKHTVRIHWYFFITYLCNSLQLPIQTLTAYVRLVISLHRYYQGKCKNYQCLSEITQSSDLKRESVIINSISVTLSKSFFFFFYFFLVQKFLLLYHLLPNSSVQMLKARTGYPTSLLRCFKMKL